jgi:hypothetical protein
LKIHCCTFYLDPLHFSLYHCAPSRLGNTPTGCGLNPSLHWDRFSAPPSRHDCSRCWALHQALADGGPALQKMPGGNPQSGEPQRTDGLHLPGCLDGRDNGATEDADLTTATCSSACCPVTGGTSACGGPLEATGGHCTADFTKHTASSLHGTPGVLVTASP